MWKKLSILKAEKKQIIDSAKFVKKNIIDFGSFKSIDFIDSQQRKSEVSFSDTSDSEGFSFFTHR